MVTTFALQGNQHTESPRASVPARPSSAQSFRLQWRWQLSLDAPIFGSPVARSQPAPAPGQNEADNGGGAACIIVADVHGRVRALDALRGHEIWRHDLQLQVFADPVCTHLHRNLAAAESWRSDRAQSTGRGEAVSKRAAASRVQQGHLYFACDGVVVLLACDTGAQLGRLQHSQGTASAAPLVLPRQLCGGMEDAQIYYKLLHVCNGGTVLEVRIAACDDVSKGAWQLDAQVLTQLPNSSFSGAVACMALQCFVLGCRDDCVHRVRIESCGL